MRYGWTSSFGVAAVLAVFSAICWLTVHPERPLQQSELAPDITDR